jgi:hypothetical protein
MKWYPLILKVEKGVELKSGASNVFLFILGLGMPHLKRDKKLVGLRKIECSSIKSTSKRDTLVLHEHV